MNDHRSQHFSADESDTLLGRISRKTASPILVGLLLAVYSSNVLAQRPSPPSSVCVGEDCPRIRPKEPPTHQPLVEVVRPLLAQLPGDINRSPELEALIKQLGFGGRVKRAQLVNMGVAKDLISSPAAKSSESVMFFGTPYKKLAGESYLGVRTGYFEAKNSYEPMLVAETPEGRIIASGSTSEGPLEIWPDPRPGAPLDTNVAMWLESADVAQASANASSTAQARKKRTPPSDGANAKKCSDQPTNSDGTLKLYVAITRAAEAAADAIHAAPTTTIANQLSVINVALWCAGANIRIDVPDAERSDFVESNDQTDPALQGMVVRLTDSSEPASAAFRQRRAAAHADIGILVIHRESKDQCGKAYDVGAKVDAKHAVIVVNWQCIGDQMVVLHELGHILGARHEDDPPSAQPTYARAFRAETFETVVAKRDDCGGHYCGRRAYFSNPNQLLGTVVIGLPNEADNARIIRQRIDEVIKFHELL